MQSMTGTMVLIIKNVANLIDRCRWNKPEGEVTRIARAPLCKKSQGLQPKEPQRYQSRLEFPVS